MAGTWTETLEALRRRIEELVDTVGEALVPRPEPIPVPVPVRGDRGRSRGRRK